MTYTVSEFSNRKLRFKLRGKISMTDGGDMLLLDADGKLALEKIESARVQWMQANGIMIHGWRTEPTIGHVEWFCKYE